MMRWLFSGWFQKFGSSISASNLVSSLCFAAASKIAPHSFALLPERNVLSFQFF